MFKCEINSTPHLLVTSVSDATPVHTSMACIFTMKSESVYEYRVQLKRQANYRIIINSEWKEFSTLEEKLAHGYKFFAVVFINRKPMRNRFETKYLSWNFRI